MNPIKSFFSSIVGALIGLAMFAGSFFFIFWNENRSVQTARSLDEGRGIVVEAAAEKANPSNEGKLIHLSGDAKAPAPLVDPATHIAVPALVLDRESEMFQWEESSSGKSNNKTYSYSTQWSSTLESSTNFHEPGHKNPDRFRIPSASTEVKEARLGAFRIPAAILREVDSRTPHELSEKDLASLPPELRRTAKLSEGWLYFSANPASPQVGDERIKFAIVPPGPLSFAARQLGDSLSEYKTSNGRTLVLADVGAVSATELFDRAVTKNKIFTWLLRGGGFLLMFIGCRLIIEPLTKFTDWIPLLGGLVDTGATLAAGLLTLVLSAATIAVAWFAVRPLMSGGILAGAVGLFVLIKRVKR